MRPVRTLGDPDANDGGDSFLRDQVVEDSREALVFHRRMVAQTDGDVTFPQLPGFKGHGSGEICELNE